MHKRRGLTIVEVFVVLLILSLLLAFLLPAVQSARERARETVCKNNLHQLNLALARFAETHNKLPASPVPGMIGGWSVAVLPFVEQQNLLQEIPVGTPISALSAELYRPPPVFQCPRRSAIHGKSTGAVWPGHYVFVPVSRRESFLLFDAPVNFNVPWVHGPELPYATVSASTGPHADGFYFASGFQQGVSFMLNGQKIE